MCLLRGLIVEKILEYMTFKAHYETVGPKEEVPVHEFMERIAPEIVLELSVTCALIREHH
jgi:transcription elongation factor B subunit 1